MKAICTRSFQRRGGIARTGQTLVLSPDEQRDPFVLAHVKIVEDDAPAPAPEHTGSGTPVQPKPTPAATAAGFDPETATLNALRKKLSELGVHYAQSQTKGELQALYAKAMEAIAGSPAETKKLET